MDTFIQMLDFYLQQHLRQTHLKLPLHVQNVTVRKSVLDDHYKNNNTASKTILKKPVRRHINPIEALSQTYVHFYVTRPILRTRNLMTLLQVQHVDARCRYYALILSSFAMAYFPLFGRVSFNFVLFRSRFAVHNNIAILGFLTTLQNNQLLYSK